MPDNKPLDTKIHDPEMGTEAMKLYAGQVAGLHTDILKPKFESMIAACHVLLEDPDNSQELDAILKGSVYALREIIKWGDSMVNLQTSYMNNQDPSREDSNINEK